MRQRNILGQRILVSLAYLFFLALPAIGEEKPVGFVSFLKGEVILVRGSSQAPLKIDDPLLKTDVVETKSGKARIVFNTEAFQGMKAIPANTRFEVGSVFAGTADSSLTALAPEILNAFSETGKEAMAFGGKRAGDARKKLILFPGKKMRGSFSRIVCRPDSAIASWSFVLRYRQGDKAVETTFPSDHAGLETGLPEFVPGIPYSLAAIGWKNGEKACEDTLLFTITAKKNEGLEKRLQEVESTITDPEDPTPHLLKGQALFAAGFASEALLEFREYVQKQGGRDLGIARLRATLERIGCDSRDLDAFPWDAFLKN